MKDFVQIWNNVTGRRYSAVNPGDRELKDLSAKLRNIDTSTFEQNFSECEGLNAKYNDELDFNERKNEIINRLFERRRQGQRTRHPTCLFILLLFGFLALAGGFFILFLQPYNFLFKQKVVFSEGGEIFEMWRKPEVDLYVKVYLFNITNAEDYMSGKADKLSMVEVGPYVYKEALEHELVSFNENGTLSAIPRHPLTWVEELSEGRHEDDILFLPHIALLSIANVVAPQSMFTRFGLNRLIGMTNSQPLVRMTAREFMMGYKSNLMTLGNTFMPGWITFDKLGLIDRMYDFKGDYETIFTGQDDMRNSGLIDTYRGSTELPQWEGKHCSNVQYASDGTKFRGGLRPNESILFFRKSLCRAAPLVPVGEGVKSGLKSYKYTFPENMMDNGKYIEENKCFCRKGKCLPAGLIDVTDCYYGFPIALSYPHFYKGDEALSNKVEGMKPSKELHETRFWIQPESGLPVDVSAKFQINMALDDISNIDNTGRFSNMHLPLLWFDIRMYTLPESMETRFRLYLNILPVVEEAAMYLLFISGVLLILLTVYRLTFKIMFKSFEKTKQDQNVIPRTHLWMDNEKNNTTGDIYAPCEIPLSDETDTEYQIEDKRKTLLKTNSRLKVLGDKVYDSISSVKERVRDEIVHVKNIFADRAEASNENTNEAYKSDSDENEIKIDSKNRYMSVGQSDSEDDLKYLEVTDSFDGFNQINVDGPVKNSARMDSLNYLDSSRNDDDELIHISE